MTKYKRNHFISKGLIGFWKRPNGQVILWDRENGPDLELRNIRSVHYRDYLYAKWDTDGNRDMRAEHFLGAEVDDKAPQVIKRLIQNWPPQFPLDPTDRTFLIELIVRTILRHPTIPNLASRSVKIRFAMLLLRAARWLGRNGEKDVAYDQYGKGRVLFGELMALSATLDIEQIVKQYVDRQISIMVLEEGAPNFVLGTQPFLLNPNGAKDDIRLGAVIHPRIFIGIHQNNGADFFSVLSKEDVCRINGFFIRQSQHIVMVSSADIEGAWFDEIKLDGTSERYYISVTANE